MSVFNLVVIGAGAGGLSAAAEAKKRGITVALVEKGSVRTQGANAAEMILGS